MLHDVTAHLFRVDKGGHSELAAPFFLGVVDIDADDPVSADQPCTLNDIQSDAAKPEHDDICSGRDLGCVYHRADASRDAAADIAALIEGSVLANFRDRDFGQHGEIGKGR